MSDQCNNTPTLERSLLEAFHTYIRTFWEQRDAEASAALASDRITGFGTGLDERVYALDRALELYARDVAEVPTPIHCRIHNSRAIALSEDVGLVMAECDWDMQIQGQAVTMRHVRMSLVMQREQRAWKVVHKHLSQPSAAHGPGEPYPLKEIEDRTRVLERMVQERTEALEKAQRRLERLAVTDTMTGLFNRAKADDVLSDEIRRRERSTEPLSVVLMDVDHFKSINDRYGHHAGDRVLRELATLLLERSRQSDCLGRWGGEEFLLICPATDAAGAGVLAEALRKVVAQTAFSIDHPITLSFGVAEYRLSDTPEQLVDRADQAMYRAKRNGRNRVELG
ncbi:diguanylate cyclase [Methylonatrum kenyense]|uniref:GGDEF domain-containing protein n=1 Tax=Methylonatrum kenyense TaxID=455253 RepID=UPI0020BD9645|nr:diguanylate cyclase [Methylonatrum kenyense]MCK8515445.1 diguanylate cyclase [Methylonatrum kenyense]